MIGSLAAGHVLVIVLGSLALAAMACAGAALWNRQLRREVELHTAEMRAVIERLKLHGVVLAQVHDAIVVVNPEGRITMWNPGAEALFGVPAAEALGRGTEDIFGAMLVGSSRAAIREQVDRTGHWRGEARIRRRTGGDVHVDATVQALQEADGAAAGRLVVVHDINARKRAENELRARLHAESEQRRLEAQIQQVQKIESLGVLAGGIAHDFNNLLVGMMGHAALALMDIPPGSPLRDRIQEIETCAARAAELTGQMLAYSGKGRFVVEPVDVGGVVREMSTLLQTAGNGVRLELDLAPALPAVLADGTQMRQVLMNLLTNAAEAMGDRAGTITLRTGAMQASRAWLADAHVALTAEPGEYVFVEVRDEGCGMDAATRQRIFEPFFTTKFAGRGLGLAAVLGIVRGHHGALRIESEPGRGTTFHVLIPAWMPAKDSSGDDLAFGVRQA